MLRKLVTGACYSFQRIKTEILETNSTPFLETESRIMSMYIVHRNIYHPSSTHAHPHSLVTLSIHIDRKRVIDDV